MFMFIYLSNIVENIKGIKIILKQQVSIYSQFYFSYFTVVQRPVYGNLENTIKDPYMGTWKIE